MFLSRRIDERIKGNRLKVKAIPKEKVSDYLENLKNSSDALDNDKNDNYFVSFTDIDKIGINPKSGYNTPTGIYTYPLVSSWKNYKVDEWENYKVDDSNKDEPNRFQIKMPFASSKPYIWVLKKKINSNILAPLDDHFYDEKSLKTDEDTLRKWSISVFSDKTKEEVEKKFDNIKTTAYETAKSNNSISKLWNLTRYMAGYYPDNFKPEENSRHSSTWNYILRSVLGYDGFCDSTGEGLIHPSEMTQAVFFNAISFTVVARLDNSYSQEKIKRSSQTITKKRKDGTIVTKQYGRNFVNEVILHSKEVNYPNGDFEQYKYSLTDYGKYERPPLISFFQNKGNITTKTEYYPHGKFFGQKLMLKSQKVMDLSDTSKNSETTWYDDGQIKAQKTHGSLKEWYENGVLENDYTLDGYSNVISKKQYDKQGSLFYSLEPKGEIWNEPHWEEIRYRTDGSFLSKSMMRRRPGDVFSWDGPSVVYWKNGNLKLKGEYIYNTKDGWFIYYDENGVETKAEFYRAGSLAEPYPEERREKDTQQHQESTFRIMGPLGALMSRQ